jgi:hypothetical protein
MGNTQTTAPSLLDAIKAVIKAAQEIHPDLEGYLEPLHPAIADCMAAVEAHKDAEPTVTLPLADLVCDEIEGPATLEGLLDDLLVTAIEGGANHWCESITCIGEKPKAKDYGEIEGFPWYTVAFQAGVSMLVKDGDMPGESEPVKLDREAGIRGLIALATKAPIQFGNLMRDKGCADAEVADCWLQCAVFGEVVYG